jgi:hypothetical protein
LASSNQQQQQQLEMKMFHGVPKNTVYQAFGPLYGKVKLVLSAWCILNFTSFF